MMEELLMARAEGLTGEIRFLGRRREDLPLYLVRRGEGLDRVGTLSTHSKEVAIEKDLGRIGSREIVLVVSME